MKMKTFKVRTKNGDRIWFADKWECVPDCGLCCEDHVAFTPRLLKTHKKDMQRTITREEQFGDYVMARTEDSMCVFLKPDKRCAIYKLRPVVCRSYGRHPQMQCPYINSMGERNDDATTQMLLENHERERRERLAQGPKVLTVGVN